MTTGRTQDAGWQIGVSRSLPHPVEQVWQTIVTRPGLWLGGGADLPGEDHATTVQVTVRPTATGTTVRFHQERMQDASERARRRAHWRTVMDRLAAALD